jgi:hypothetical protein
MSIRRAPKVASVFLPSSLTKAPFYLLFDSDAHKVAPIGANKAR